ncbi:MAG TPA: NAD(P)-dependent oxidoreductase [Burkholderiales bacterium]|nr:NAD(P)-dependent oxidoreductase [Burkholderiales bacterium]
MTRHVLVTGALGFLGYPALLAAAGEGWDVTGLDLLQPPQPIPGAHFVRGDITNVHQIYRVLRERAIDTIIHTGGISGPMLERDDPFLVCSANVIGTINLLEAARVNGVRRFVFLSSAHAYGDTPPPPVTEEAPFRTRDIYGASKASGDLLLRAYREQYKLDAVALRISNGYGPRRVTRDAIRIMLQDAIAGRPTSLDFGGGYGRTYVYVKDAVDAIMAAVKAPSVAQPAYNITGTEFVSMQHIADIVRKLFPKASITMAEGVDPLGYRREQLDVSAAARDLGWAPQWTLERGIVDYAQWLRANP